VFATKLDVRERMRTAQDVAALAEQGALPLGDALPLVPTLLADADLRPVRTGVAMLRLLHPDEQPAAQQKAYGRLVAKLLASKARAAGWAPRAGEDPMMTELRPILWQTTARWTDDAAAATIGAEARRLAEAWLADRKAVAPDMVQTALVLSARYGNGAWYERLVVEAMKVSDRRERTQLMAALGMFREDQVRARALALLLDPQIDLRDSLSVLAGSWFDPAGRDAAWEFLKMHWDALTPRLRADETMGLVGEVPFAFCDEKHRKEVAEFFGPRVAKHPGAPHVLAEALERVDVCTAAVKRGRGAVESFLAAY
jgi:alanyl aminopeptidase